MTSDASPATRPRPQLVFRALLRADFIVLIKNRRSLLLGILLPLIILFATNAQKSQQRLGGSFVIIGLSITYGLISTSIQGYAITVARDREKGVFQRLRCTPAPTWMIMTSRLAIQVIANLIIATVVVVIGTNLHHVALSPLQYALILAISTLGGAVFLSIGQALVGLLKSAEMVNAGGRIVFAALIFLGIFGLTGILGTTVESIAKWTPVGAVISLFSIVLSSTSWTSHDTLALATCAVYIVVFAVIGIRWFKWDAR